VHEALQASPVATTASLRQKTGLTAPPIARAIETLEALGIVREITGRLRDRVWEYTAYLAVLSEGAEPL
jgi:DNA-binding Lrp family transcriptional regulator